MTLLGPCPCHGCGRPVTVVRRPVVIRGHAGAGCGCRSVTDSCATAESAELREVVVLSGDTEHLCYTGGAEYSGASDIMHTATRPAARLYSELAGRLRSGVQTE